MNHNINTTNLFRWLDSQTVGLAAQLREMAEHAVDKYPPHDIIQDSVDENKFIVALAVAGFKKSELEVELENNTLTVKGTHEEVDNSNVWHHRGIANRNFNRSWTLGEYVELQKVTLVDGMLSIYLEKIVPEKKKARKVDID